MPRGDWRPYAAAGGLLGFALLVWSYVALDAYRSEHAKERQHSAAYSTKNSPEQERQRCRVISRAGHRDCDGYTPDPEGTRKPADYDLRAQQDVAEWTFAAFLIGAFGLLLNVVGVVFVVVALKLNAEATKAATETANTAKRQLEDLERPYLFARVKQETSWENAFAPVGDGPPRGALGPQEFDPSDATVFEFINRGRSPAMILRFNRRRHWRWLSEGPPPPLNPVTNPGFPVSHGVVVPVDGPSQEFRVTGEFSRGERLDAVDDSDTKQAFFLGFVVYRDMMGQRHIAGFGYQYDAWSKAWFIINTRRSPDEYNYDRKLDPSEPPSDGATAHGGAP